MELIVFFGSIVALMAVAYCGRLRVQVLRLAEQVRSLGSPVSRGHVTKTVEFKPFADLARFLTDCGAGYRLIDFQARKRADGLWDVIREYQLPEDGALVC